MINIRAINNFILELNQELYEQTENDEIAVELKSIGHMISIEFLGVHIWNSKNDEREEIYEDIYEELEPFVRNKINELVKTILNIHL